MNLDPCKAPPWWWHASHQELQLNGHTKELIYKLAGAVKNKGLASSEE